MPDPYLEAMVKGEGNSSLNSGKFSSKNKSRYEIAVDEWIETQLDQIDFDSESEYDEVKLLTPEMRRAQKKTELQHVIRDAESKDSLIKASNIIYSEGRTILGLERYEQVIIAFQNMSNKLQVINFENNLDQNLQTLLEVDDATIEALDEIAIHLFAASRYTECQALCTLLSTLSPENGDYLYRAGLAAQNEGNIAEALKFYESALSDDPKLIGAYLFSAECHLNTGSLDEAEACLEKVRILLEENIDPSWIDLLNQLDYWLASAKAA